MSAISTHPSQYSVAQCATDFSSFVSSPSGAQDTLGIVGNVCDWMAHLDINKELASEVSETLDPLGRTFSLIGLFEHFNGLRNAVQMGGSKDSDEVRKAMFRHSTLGVAKAADTATLLHDTKIYVFKGGLKSIKATFWAASGIFDVVNIYSKAEVLQGYTNELDKAPSKEVCSILSSKINLTHLQMLQSITLVAMAAISLVSITFASMAEGVLFSPGVMLGLSSAWLALSFVCHFYGRVIAHREGQLAPQAGPSPVLLGR